MNKQLITLIGAESTERHWVPLVLGIGDSYRMIKTPPLTGAFLADMDGPPMHRVIEYRVISNVRNKHGDWHALALPYNPKAKVK